ncbi:MAG: hypothetical protein PHE88_02245 [Elusimicrobia bacterium]|nr:hypothetical protein [Elusimicrobiota bacterium]
MDRIDVLLKNIKEIEPSENFRRNFWKAVDKREKRFSYYALLKFVPSIFIIGLIIGVFTAKGKLYHPSDEQTKIFSIKGIDSFSDFIFKGIKQ